MKTSRKIIYSSLFVIVLLFIFAGLSEAADSYKFLVDSLPGIGSGAGSTDEIGNYIGVLYKIGISLATGLAVIMVIWGGVEYMTTDAWGKKENGKERISSALFGLLLALTSYVLLKTIDESFVNLSLFNTIDDLKDEIGGLPNIPINPLTGKPFNQNNRDYEGNYWGDDASPEYQAYRVAMVYMMLGLLEEGMVSGKFTEFGFKDSEDNGVGSPLLGDGTGYGVLTDDPNVDGVAIPIEALRAYFNIASGDYSYSSWEPVRRAGVEVIGSNGFSTIVPIVDIGPGQKPVANGVVLDTTHHLNSALGGDGNATYRIIPNYYNSDDDRPVTYTPAP